MEYFLIIEDDIYRVARYVELTPANFSTYSVEMARILMTATQEIDVLFKQTCAVKGNIGINEQAYRSFIPSVYPNIVKAEVQLVHASLLFTPFSSWVSDSTPSWWTANNKVKHERHNHFSLASLENMLNAVCGVLFANI